jgi:hypothetical protein
MRGKVIHCEEAREATVRIVGAEAVISMKDDDPV